MASPRNFTKQKPARLVSAPSLSNIHDVNFAKFVAPAIHNVSQDARDLLIVQKNPRHYAIIGGSVHDHLALKSINDAVNRTALIGFEKVRLGKRRKGSSFSKKDKGKN